MNVLNGKKAQRLSKLQKWILITTYKKTIMANTDGFTIVKTYDYRKRTYIKCQRDILKPRFEKKIDITSHYLFRSEILLNYFKREMPEVRNNDICFSNHFVGNGNKEQVILTRSLYNLERKGLILIRYGENIRSQGIRLVKKGRDTAIGLIANIQNVNNKNKR